MRGRVISAEVWCLTIVISVFYSARLAPVFTFELSPFPWRYGLGSSVRQFLFYHQRAALIRLHSAVVTRHLHSRLPSMGPSSESSSTVQRLQFNVYSSTTTVRLLNLLAIFLDVNSSGFASTTKSIVNSTPPQVPDPSSIQLPFKHKYTPLLLSFNFFSFIDCIVVPFLKF